MRLAIMQPYFFPYIGYFSLIKNVDLFILFDTPQFIRHGWIERNQILKADGEPIYIKVHLKKHSREATIDKVLINNGECWREKIFAQLIPYKKNAPNYWKVINLVKEILEFETESIVALNHYALVKTCAYLGIETPIRVWSEMGLAIEEVNAPDEWALNICKSLNANEYYNPIGGMSFFDRSKYTRAGIDIKFLEAESISYNQYTNTFTPFLSVIDMLMFCDIHEANHLINNFKLK